MGYSKEKIKQICGLMAFGALLVLAVRYSELVCAGILLLIDIAKPFIVGGMIAFVLNLPMRAIEERLLGKWKGKAAQRCRRPISILLAIIVVALIVVLVIATVVPQISQTVAVLGNKIPIFFEQSVIWLGEISENYPELEEYVSALQNVKINWESLADSAVNFLKNGVGSMLTSTVSVASSIIGGIVNFVIAFIFALYILSQKEKLAGQGRRIITAYCSEKLSARILRVFSLLYKNFSSFITGQCLEAVILGTMFVITMSIFRLPYAFMIGVLIAFTALIPVVGAFIGCGVGAFLILIENPIMAVWFVVLFLVLQQIEGNLIYPKVVGNSVGLPSIWVLMAVSLGGSLFGVAGMLFFIPLLATFYTLLRENVNKRNTAKQERRLEEAVSEEADSGENTSGEAESDEIASEETVPEKQNRRRKQVCEEKQNR